MTAIRKRRQQLEHAVALHNTGDLPAAAAEYERLVLAEPDQWEPAFLLGVLRFQQQDFTAARGMLGRVVELNPKHADAWFYLGEAGLAVGDTTAAAKAYERATALAPRQALAWFGLGLAREQLGAADTARTAYEKAIAVRPDFAEALNNLGSLVQAAGGSDAAIALFDRALAAKPGMSAAATNLAALQIDVLDDYPAAIQTLRRAVEINPGDAGLRFQLGTAYGRQGRAPDARAAYESAIEHAPQHADALNNLGVLHFQAWRNAEAEDCYRRALVAQPGHVHARANLGNLLLRLGRFDDAVSAFEGALALRPGMEEALNGLALVLNERGHLDRAETVLREAIALHPTSMRCLANLGNVLQRLGRLDEARGFYDCALALEDHPALRIKRALMLSPVMASIESLDAERARFEADVDTLLGTDLEATEAQLLQFPETCFFLAYHGRNDRDLLAKVAKLYLTACPTLAYTAPHALQPQGPGPIRIGFVSRFLYSHAVGRFFGPVIEAIARDPAFEVTLFTLGYEVDDHLRRLAAVCRRHVEIPYVELAYARKLIEHEQLDLLVYPEIGMDPFTYLLSFSRLARVQAVLHGHSVTSGVPNQDYYISSALIEPPDADAQYSEHLVRLPTLPMFIEPPALPSAPRSRAELGLPTEGTLYLCPMKLQKVHPSMDAAVAQVLARDPDARIVFIEDHGNSAWHALLRGRLDAAAGPHRDRVHFVPWRMRLADFIELILAADVVLDSFHHGGATTAHLCLACGKPMVTWVTDTSRSRFLAAYYGMVGVNDCLADSPESYIDTAVRLGTDEALREATAQRIHAGRPGLYRNQAVFAAYRVFFQSVAHTDRVATPLRSPYRALRTVESWCAEQRLNRTIAEPERRLEIPVTHVFDRPWTAERTPVRLAPVALSELHDVDIIGRETLVLPADGRTVIYDLPLLYPEDRVEVTSALVTHRAGDDVLVRHLPRAGAAIDRGILLCGPATGNYYHWLFEQLPKLRLLDEAPQYDDWPLLVDAGHHPNLRAALARVNRTGRPVIEIEAGIRHRVHRLLVPEAGVRMPVDFRAGATVYADDILFAPRALAYLRRRFLPAGADRPGHRRLYLRRGPASYRRLLNEERVQAEFVARGFEVVEPGGLSLDEQIALFSQAAVIAGPTGAGMANMVFAPAQCRVLVLYYDSVPYFYFSTLAATLQQNLMYVLGEPDAGSNANLYQRDFTIEPACIGPALDALGALPPIAPITASGDFEAGGPTTAPAIAATARYGFLMHIPELFNHYRAIWRRLPSGSFEVVNAGTGEDAAQIAALAHTEGVSCADVAQVEAAQARYEVLISNHPIDPSGTTPLIRRLGHVNVRLMYSVGKAGWNLREWNQLYDLILCFGPYQREALAAVTDSTIVEVGYPRFDTFFELEPRRRVLLESMNGDPAKRTVVWLPTWKNLSSVGWHDAAIAALTSEFNVFVKLHPLMSQQEPDKVAALRALGFTLVIADSSDNIPLYVMADWVLCDYGGPAFGAIYTDRNLLLLDVPEAEADSMLGEASPDLLIRQVIPHVAPGSATALREVLGDAALWDEQRRVRRELRSAFFAPHFGYSAAVAAEALLHAERLVPAQRRGGA